MMESRKVEANLNMVVSKTFSGLNMDTLKYLLPVWVNPLSGVTLRCVFTAVAFWIIGMFVKPGTSTCREEIYLFLLDALGIYGSMFLYLMGLSKTTPVSSSIFTNLQPIWVFVIAVVFFKEKISILKVAGISLGLGGAVLCILIQKSNDLTSDALTGNVLCLLSSITYTIYLVASNRILKSVGVFMMSKYTFVGATFSSVLVSAIAGFHAPVSSEPVHWFPLSVLLLVLAFLMIVSYLLAPIGLKYPKAIAATIYGYLILMMTAIVPLLVGQDRFSWAQTITIDMICISVHLVEVVETKKKPLSSSDKPSSPPPHRP